MREVNKAVRKKDAMELLLGKPVYTDDIAPKDCLVVKLLRSPHANAIVKEINTDKAMLVPGIEAVYTWKDIDQNQKRFTCAGQTYPEMSPYDRLLLEYPSCVHYMKNCTRKANDACHYKYTVDFFSFPHK